jgi:hypothetical protein
LRLRGNPRWRLRYAQSLAFAAAPQAAAALGFTQAANLPERHLR